LTASFDIKEVQAAAAEAVKDLASHEKQEVGLEERRKHATGKAKKLKKSLHEVSAIFSVHVALFTFLQDQNSLAEATRTITDSAAKMERERQKVEELEASLDSEEKLLEKIRDSLRGLSSYPFSLRSLSCRSCADKTQVFHDQIEVKQRELQPWTAKINSQQAEINVATSERDALAKKATAVKQACVEAQEYLDKLQTEQQAKVRTVAS
jgi:structural maintenance of chromosome 4